MEAKVYSREAKETGKVTLPEEVFGAKWNPDLVHQAVLGMKSNARIPIAHTKDRSEVSGGGKKPWRQKGTGRARHGSIRSPIWKGGGITFGPRKEKNYSKKINKKMKRAALYSVLSRKLKDNEILFIDKLSFQEPNTKAAKETLLSLSGIKGFDKLLAKKKNSAIIATPERDAGLEKSFRNFSNIAVGEIRNANPADLLSYKYLLIVGPAQSAKILAKEKRRFSPVAAESKVVKDKNGK